MIAMRTASCALALALALGASSCHTAEEPPPVGAARERSEAMRITFRRSGGIAALPGLAIDGTVDLGSTPPRVSAESSGYERTLDAQEAERLRAATSALRAPHAKSALVAAGRDLRDAHAYELTVEFADGKRETVSFNAAAGGDALKGSAPAIAPLVDWLHAETERIKQHRLAR